jgi:5-methylcytosine-specific restriction endonuclease McrA
MHRTYYESEARRLEHEQRYRAYLNTDRWAEIKRAIWCRDNGMCQECGKACGQDRPGHVHHNSYAHLFDERNNLDDLDLLCVECHDKRHNNRSL